MVDEEVVREVAALPVVVELACLKEYDCWKVYQGATAAAIIKATMAAEKMTAQQLRLVKA